METRRIVEVALAVILIIAFFLGLWYVASRLGELSPPEPKRHLGQPMEPKANPLVPSWEREEREMEGKSQSSAAPGSNVAGGVTCRLSAFSQDSSAASFNPGRLTQNCAEAGLT